MKVTHFPCGPTANQSEEKCFWKLTAGLKSSASPDTWVLLTNLAFSVNHQLQADEIDLIAIGPPGVRVIEVKHWSSEWIKNHPQDVDDEAHRISNKARKIATTLRAIVPDLSYVSAVILLTHESIKEPFEQPRRGVYLYTLQKWQDALNLQAAPTLSSPQIELLASRLQPRSQVAVNASLRRFLSYVNLERASSSDDRFHRVYKGSHSTRRDKIVLHLYDLSSESNTSHSLKKAEREFEVLRRFQLYRWAPRVLDSFQHAPGYAGEMYFFTIVDPDAPSLAQRQNDRTWSFEDRLKFACASVQALNEFHTAFPKDQMVHRSLTPATILVRHDNSPIFTQFALSRLASEGSVLSSSTAALPDPSGVLAPEIQQHGLTAAEQASDVYALCTSLLQIFCTVDSTLSQKVIAVLQKGQRADPGQREPLPSLAAALNELAEDKNAQRPLPPVHFWSEGQQISFHQREYQIVSKLGEGNIGITFKVAEIDRSTQEELGTYVAKVIHQRDASTRILRAYSLAKPHLRHRSLSLIHEVASEWQENSFAALMTWVSGVPLADYTGVFSLLAEDQQARSAEALALHWLTAVCTALEVLHRNGLLHGDVSPRNLIVEGDSLVLIDYDFVHRLEELAPGPGTLLYQPSYQQGQPARFSDDIYALAASFFHVVFDKKPFDHAGQLDKTRGLNWEGIDHAEFPTLADFLNRATHPQADQRFASTHEALAALSPPPYRSTAETPPATDVQPPAAPAESPPPTEPPPGLSPQEIKWLLPILQSYPGSRWGNSETRGLDTAFAASTYVKTDLEELLLSDIRSQRVQLVILCGNAGDGKTALLQHLAAELGFGSYPSASRVLNHTLADGTRVNMNLDGSAAWRGQSADQILDEFLEPFQQGPPAEKQVSLLAINDGRLFEWIEGVERRKGGQATPLTRLLSGLLQKETVGQELYVRFVNLNQRSLVGSLSHDGKQIETNFLNRLIDQLYGGAETKSFWLPCLSCSAQPHCRVFQTAQLLGPATFPMAAPPEARTRARERLTEAFQAVHLRGETHITVREVRAALVYILFGTEYCSDYHEGAKAWPYWDRAFAADSPARQGELLRDLVRFDPALETHPQVDRQLGSKLTHSYQHNAPRYPDLSLASARRRAFFEWSANDIEQVTQRNDSLDLAHGQYLRPFRNLPLEDDAGRQALCQTLCRGIARLEDLPPQALERLGVVPLRITPRTPTDTAFWVEKPLTAFRLEADLPPVEAGIERLHRQASLVYTYRNGRSEKLRMGAELFCLLMELADGYQLGDVSTDDTFTQLSIFVQRLVREDERSLFAWNPMQDATIYQVAAVDPVDAKAQQRLVIKALGEPQ